MPIRRKSDAQRELKQCSYHEQMEHERTNQIHHEVRRLQPEHDQLAECWCCCDDCTDLVWYYPARKGTWWEVSPNGGLQLMQETCAESPGSPVTRPCS